MLPIKDPKRGFRRKSPDQKRVRLPAGMRTKYTWCPRRCTQHRTPSYGLGESKTFDGHRCENCGYVHETREKPTFSKYTYKKKERLDG